jgi:hypothetical protein
MKKTVCLTLLCFMLGTAFLFAAETSEEPGKFKQILKCEGRGIVNAATFPFELLWTPVSEHRDHPRAWPLTYFPRVFANFLTRAGSAFHDVAVNPVYVIFAGDSTPLTRRMDMPDYFWQKQ